jgi:hypothetical protein
MSVYPKILQCRVWSDADFCLFSPVTRKNAGSYICQAENSIGKSDEERTIVSILCKLYNSNFSALFTQYLPRP